MDYEEIANRLALRAWKLNDHLNRALVPQEDRELLFIEITREEANALLVARRDYAAPRFSIQFLHLSPETDRNGFRWDQTLVLNDPMPPVTLFPEKGKPWAVVYGIRLVWLGN
jgi:hypothetical protein